jgi:hypothetical protein
MGASSTKVMRLSAEFSVERRTGLYAELKAILGAGAVQ